MLVMIMQMVCIIINNHDDVGGGDANDSCDYR